MITFVLLEAIRTFSEIIRVSRLGKGNLSRGGSVLRE